MEDWVTKKDYLQNAAEKKYTCNEYREEMRLLGLKKRLNEKDLSKTEKQTIEAEITKLEKALRMD